MLFLLIKELKIAALKKDNFIYFYLDNNLLIFLSILLLE
ncbi:hypothetical protein AWRIB429_1637 [Oenococcus oeni AWRIB429]|uniref:Uncharacterized protein n=2 Tax=Oenococcus oeni TaxID=1247 RepID=Q04DL5_OENOB|nr:hypothetical protein OEOE_1605 [Oenococcus oeni PSU-1]EFD87811.1 hypothetical protein AWRIB429_1637 [Oenococcus oeni AWRIB429]KEP86285.1 hypothetical protein X278_03195 [Oenococcus oeni IOEB_0205]KZD14732.1 hypothetical protein AC229_1569 [Oenococcus oeni]